MRPVPNVALKQTTRAPRHYHNGELSGLKAQSRKGWGLGERADYRQILDIDAPSRLCQTNANQVEIVFKVSP